MKSLEKITQLREEISDMLKEIKPEDIQREIGLFGANFAMGLASSICGKTIERFEKGPFYLNNSGQTVPLIFPTAVGWSKCFKPTPYLLGVLTSYAPEIYQAIELISKKYN